MLIASPLIMLLGVAVDARTRSEGFESVSYSPEATDRLFAYTDFVRKICEVRHSPQDLDYPKRLRRVAKEWVEMFDLGILQPIPSEFSTDTIQTGPKAEIGENVEYVVTHLLRLGRSAPRLRLAEGVEDILLSMRVAQTLKYADLAAVGAFSHWQRQALNELDSRVPHMDAALRERLAGALEALRQQERSLMPLALRARRNYLRESRLIGIARQDIEEAARFLTLGDLMERDGDERAIRSATGRLLLAYGDGPPPSYVTEIRYAWSALRAQRERLEELIAKLRGEP